MTVTSALFRAYSTTTPHHFTVPPTPIPSEPSCPFSIPTCIALIGFNMHDSTPLPLGLLLCQGQCLARAAHDPNAPPQLRVEQVPPALHKQHRGEALVVPLRECAPRSP